MYVNIVLFDDFETLDALDRQKFSESFRRNFISVIFLSPEM